MRNQIKYLIIVTFWLNAVNTIAQPVPLNLVKWSFTEPGNTEPTLAGFNPYTSRMIISDFEGGSAFTEFEVSSLAPVQGNPGRSIRSTGWYFSFLPRDVADNGCFFQIQITPLHGNYISINNIIFDIIADGGLPIDRPNAVAYRYKIGTDTFQLFSDPKAITGAWTNIDFTLPKGAIQNQNNPVTIQIVAYNQNSISNYNDEAEVRLDNLSFSPSSTLPIELTTFTATPVPAGIEVAWSTASEVNNAYVAIERSTDGSRFDEINRVPGEGDSFEKKDYQYTDETPEKGVNYYRLRQVDFDGAETYSSTVQAQFGKAGKLILYPSPATDLLNVAIEETDGEPVRWDVYDASGRLALSGAQEADIVIFPIELGNIPEGVYTLQMFLGREVMTERFVKK